MTSTEGDPYLIWSIGHRAWWQPNRRGYTYDIRTAGQYSREEALKICGWVEDRGRQPNVVPDQVPIRLADVPEDLFQ